MMLNVSNKSHGGDIFHFYLYRASEAGKDNKHLYLANIVTKGDFDARVGESSESDDVMGILGQGQCVIISEKCVIIEDKCVIWEQPI